MQNSRIGFVSTDTLGNMKKSGTARLGGKQDQYWVAFRKLTYSFVVIIMKNKSQSLCSEEYIANGV